MKQFILVCISILLFSACQPKGPERWTTDAPEIDMAKALVKDYEAGNWEAWAGHYADSAKVHHNSVDVITSQDLKEALATDNENYSKYGFSDKDMFLERIITDDGDIWVYFWANWEGTMKGSNNSYVIPVHLALKFVDNKIVQEYGFYNRSPIDAELKQMQDMKMAEEEAMMMKK